MPSVQLKEYQKLAAEFWRSSEKRVLFGLPPGSGKTIIALTIILEEVKRNPNAFIVLVSPASLLMNFPHTIDSQKWGIKYKVVQDPEDLKMNTIKNYNLIICSYHFLSKYYKDFYFLGRKVDLFIADEVHYAKNAGTSFSLALFLLSRLSEKVAIFTASYVALDLSELRQMLMYLIMSEEEKRIVASTTSVELLNRNKKLFDKYTFIISKDHINKFVKVPKVEIQEIIVELSEEETKLLTLFESKLSEDLREKLVKEIPTANINLPRNTIVALQQILLFPTYLSKFSQDPRATEETIKKLLGGKEYSSKVEQFLILAKALKNREPKSKHVVFVPFVEYGAEKLFNIMNSKGLKTAIFSGQLSTVEKVEAVEEFIDEKSGIDFIILTMAGREGLNLQVSKYCHFLGYSWNPEDINQIIGRLVRINSPHDTVYVYFYHAIKNKKLVKEKLKDKTTIYTIDSHMLRKIEERIKLKAEVEKLVKKASLNFPHK